MHKKVGKVSLSSDAPNIGIFTDQEGRKSRFNWAAAQKRIPSLKDGDWISVQVGIRQATGRQIGGNPKLISEEQNIELLKECFSSSDPTLWKIVTHTYLNSLSYASALAEAEQKCTLLKSQTNKIFVIENLPLLIHLQPEATALRMLLSVKRRLALLQRLEQSIHSPVSPSLRQEIDSLEKEVTHLEITTLANREDAIRQRRWERLFHRIFELPKFDVNWDAKGVYKSLDDRDLQLAAKWCTGDGNVVMQRREMARMLSARAAERVAQQFYQSLSHEVTDVAVTQLANQGREWRTHDLSLETGEAIDVKNARSPVSKIRYVDHCVPVFKETRNLQPSTVTIAGVLSPYLKLNYIKGPSQIWFDVRPITFLGETNYFRILALEDKYSRENIEIKVLGDFGSARVTKAGRVKGHTIPPWIFQYPPRFYQSCTNARKELREQVETDLPTYEDFERWGIRPFAALLAAGVPLPRSWQQHLSPQQIELYQQLLPDRDWPLTLPDVFLAILTNFLAMVRSANVESFHPSLYKELVYPSWGEQSQKRPLGLFDPLEIIWTLCSALTTLWEKGLRQKLLQFHKFRFQGLGLLRAIPKESDEELTILAYCGGIDLEKGKCGFSPLVWGEHDTCEECNKLVCPKCDFCSEGCIGQQVRYAITQQLSESHEGDMPEMPPWLETPDSSEYENSIFYE